MRYCHLHRSKQGVRRATRPAESRGDLWVGRVEGDHLYSRVRETTSAAEWGEVVPVPG